MTTPAQTLTSPIPATPSVLVHPKYRADIDGLRAIAVLLVVAYHAFPALLPGGFIGVDVFFVISGFLISGIIFGSIRQGTFSFIEFYARRIKRIFPALSIVLISLYALGWFTLFADEFKLLGKHILAGAGFVSNVVLWGEAGYFDTSADTKPLLHLWSLGIEEQFYIFYPLFIWVVSRARAGIPTFLVVAGFASFVINVVTAMPGSVAAFYSPLTRFWELLLGASLAYRALHKPMASPRSGVGLATVMGLGLLGLAACTFDQRSTFPGWNALMPTVGTGLIIWAGGGTLINRFLLGNKALVAIGLISYPLYLWHWPLISMGRILGYNSTTERLLYIAMSFILATLTYHLIEKPIRFKKKGRGTVWKLVCMMLLLALAGFATYRAEGFPLRAAGSLLGENAEELATNQPHFNPHGCPAELANDKLQLAYCKTSKATPPQIALFGDSHANDKFNGLAVSDSERSWLLVATSSCPPVKGINVNTDHPHCREKAEAVINYLTSSSSIQTVVLSFYGGYALDTNFAADHVANNRGPSAFTLESPDHPGRTRSELLMIGLENTVEMLEKAKKQVVILIDAPELPFFPRDCLRSSAGCTLAPKTVLERQATLRALIKAIQTRHPALLVYDPLPLFCDRESCHYAINDKVIYQDSHHLSEWGSSYLARNVLEWLKRH